MKKLFLLLLIFSLMLACRNGNKEPAENTPERIEENHRPSDTTSGSVEGELQDEAATETDGVLTKPNSEEPEREKDHQAGLEGRYLLLDSANPQGNCGVCNCIEVSFASTSELCITPNEIYISGRFEKNGEGGANLYFENVGKYEAPENEIPWEDFDKTTPIATIKLLPDGKMELDWLGFSVNGEIAVDYAIYGKKTLEGSYRKVNR